MRSSPLLICLAAALAACSAPPKAAHAPAAAGGESAMLDHAGRWLTDAQGRVVVLHGLNMVAKLPPYTLQSVGFGDDDAAFLEANGFNVIRVGMMWSGVEPQPGVYDDAYLEQVADTVAALAKHHVYSLVDFHEDAYSEAVGGQGFPAWSVNTDAPLGLPLPNIPIPSFPSQLLFAWDHFWANDAAPDGTPLWDRFALFWQHVAARFAGDPWVAGYDLINEPNPGTQLPLCANPLICPFDATLGTFYRFAMPKLREIDPAHLLWYEPNILAGAGMAENIDIGGDPRAVLSFHNYCALTAVSSGQIPGDVRQPFCPVSETFDYIGAESQAARNGDALVMTEFGSVPDVDEITRVADAADARGIGWTEWTYTNTGSTNFAGSYSVVLDPHQPPTGDNIDAALLLALARPYPQVTAGTPEGWAFDSDSRAFTFSYTPARADGAGRFPAGAESVVVLPAVQYPAGYTATASGARIVSAPGAVRLRLQACDGAAAITLTVTPGTGLNSGC